MSPAKSKHSGGRRSPNGTLRAVSGAGPPLRHPPPRRPAEPHAALPFCPGPEMRAAPTVSTSSASPSISGGAIRTTQEMSFWIKASRSSAAVPLRLDLVTDLLPILPKAPIGHAMAIRR